MNTDAPVPPPDPAGNASSPPPRLNRFLFLSVLLAPTLLTILAVLVDKQSDLVPAISLYGGGLAGIIGGTMLGRRVGETIAAKVALGFVFALVLSVACIGMSCVGCLASGYWPNS